MFVGFRWAARPQDYTHAGLVPATVPRTVRAFGILTFVIGAANLAINLSSLTPE